VQGVGCELEPALLAFSGSDIKILAGSSYTLLDVLEVFLEDLDG